jgi:cellulose synthase/poly-beta-1,6-N-acetylglucosamine synthase-like glycosyltransferase
MDGLTCEGVHAMVFMKRQNKRKWDSIVFFFLLIRMMRIRAPEMFPDYVLCVDSDTQLVESDTHQSMRELVARFELFPSMIAACGETCVANIDTGFISKSQVWEYFSSFNYDKAFESCFGRVTCLPGCMTMFRGSMLASSEFFASVIRKFAARPDSSSLIGTVLYHFNRWP